MGRPRVFTNERTGRTLLLTGEGRTVGETQLKRVSNALLRGDHETARQFCARYRIDLADLEALLATASENLENSAEEPRRNDEDEHTS